MGGTEARRRAHWIAGVVTLVVFNLTGAYMRWVHDPPVWLLPDGVRATYHSRHLFLLWVAVVNLALAGELTGAWGAAFSAVSIMAPVALLAAFFVEPARGFEGHVISVPVLYAVFAVAVVMAIKSRSRP